MSLYTDRGVALFPHHQGRRRSTAAVRPRSGGRSRNWASSISARFFSPGPRPLGARVPARLQDRLGVKEEFKLAGIADSRGGSTRSCARSICPAHNARFAVDPAGEGSAFTPIPGVDLDEILCRGGAARSAKTNCVSYRTLKLQIPETPMRPHFRQGACSRCMSIPTARTPSSTGQDASAATTRKAGRSGDAKNAA